MLQRSVVVDVEHHKSEQEVLNFWVCRNPFVQIPLREESERPRHFFTPSAVRTGVGIVTGERRNVPLFDLGKRTNQTNAVADVFNGRIVGGRAAIFGHLLDILKVDGAGRDEVCHFVAVLGKALRLRKGKKILLGPVTLHQGGQHVGQMLADDERFRSATPGVSNQRRRSCIIARSAHRFINAEIVDSVQAGPDLLCFSNFNAGQRIRIAQMQNIRIQSFTDFQGLCDLIGLEGRVVTSVCDDWPDIVPEFSQNENRGQAVFSARKRNGHRTALVGNHPILLNGQRRSYHD